MVGGQGYAPVTLLLGKRAITHYTGSWVGPRTGLDGCGKPRSYQVSKSGPSIS
jgi:hypothetical protein